MIDGLLIYPKLGTMDDLITDIPLSIIYAAAHSVKRGYNMKALDMRCVKGDWKEVLSGYLDEGVVMVGISVMTGSPLHYARQVSLFVKSKYPSTKIVWGGPHVTVLPGTIEEPYIDFIIRGYGSVPLMELIQLLKSGNSDFSVIKGLSYKDGGKVFHNPRSTEFEMLHYKDIPYYLLDVTSPDYTRTYMGKRMFPVFTSIGCPYKCSFCIHPTVYKAINGPKWLPFPDDEIISNIEFVIREFGGTHICVMDDTGFPDLNRIGRIFRTIVERGIKITLEFRGARVNEIDRMDDDFLDLMVRAGVRVLMVGVESASDRILKNMQKGITKEQIIRVNKKLSRHPEIIPHYNFIYGTPGETYPDLIETKDVIMQLISENKSAYFGFGSDWKPIPGSKMLETAQREYGFKPPVSLDDWIEMDSLDSKKKIAHGWYTKKHNNMIKLLQITSFVIADGFIKETAGNKSPFFIFMRFLARVYKPLAWLRLRFNIHQLLIEYRVWRLLVKIIPLVKSPKRPPGK